MQNICNGVIWPYNSGGIDREREVLQMDRGSIPCHVLPLVARIALDGCRIAKCIFQPYTVWDIHFDLCTRVEGTVPHAALLVRGGYGAGHPVFVELPRDGGTRRDRGDHQRF